MVIMHKSKKGSAGVVGTILAVGSAVLAIVIIGVIVAEFFGGINTSTYSATAQAKISDMQSKSWTALGLLAILLLVIVGAAMIGVLGGWGR